jgi:hypothetical protein
MGNGRNTVIFVRRPPGGFCVSVDSAVVEILCFATLL